MAVQGSQQHWNVQQVQFKLICRLSNKETLDEGGYGGGEGGRGGVGGGYHPDH